MASAGQRALGATMSLCRGSGSSDIFCHVVTPDRIPQFIIPCLDVHKKQRCPGKGVGQLEGTAWSGSRDAAVQDEQGSNSSSFNSSSFNSSSFNSSCSNPDPTARAALSLPHLPKVTTPYGFVTLGRSPQVTSEEAFFHSGSGHPRGPGTRPSWQEEPGCCGHPGIPAAEGDSGTGGSQRDHEQPSPGASDGSSPTPAGLPLPRCARDIRMTEALESQEAEKRHRRLLGMDLPRGSCGLELPAVTARKNLFQRILRRHLVHPRFTLHWSCKAAPRN